MWSDALVLRGDEATRARPVVFGNELPPTEVMATGPWADSYNEVRAAARQDGFRQGLAEGLEVGVAEGHQEVVRRSGEALQALGAAADRLARADAATAAELAPQVVEIALELARLVLQREVATASDPGLDALRRVLPLVPDRGELVVRLHPDDLRTLGRYQELAPGRDVVVVPDPDLGRGDAVVDVGPCRIDGRLDEAFARVARVLRGEEAS